MRGDVGGGLYIGYMEGAGTYSIFSHISRAICYQLSLKTEEQTRTASNRRRLTLQCALLSLVGVGAVGERIYSIPEILLIFVYSSEVAVGSHFPSGFDAERMGTRGGVMGLCLSHCRSICLNLLSPLLGLLHSADETCWLEAFAPGSFTTYHTITPAHISRHC